ncbi:hypothetical protein SAY86_009572 [Trapa natans]|uniref:Gnk2-homologous domain-containing protein n=1 Tax=Trapa natans TaxID=22666 RepID=A0AAN7L525_TRANT|nr:hypothetical protein SAY86_009572 [Trapa natans]
MEIEVDSHKFHHYTHWNSKTTVLASHRDKTMFASNQHLHFFFPFLLLSLCCINSPAHSAINTYILRSCNQLSNVSSGSQAAENIRRLVPELVSATKLNGYNVTAYGQNKDKVYGLAQCRGDISKRDCKNCIEHAAIRVGKECPNLSDVTIWYDFCFLRYNLDNFFNQVDTGFGIYKTGKKNVLIDPKTFDKGLGALIAQVKSEAVKPGNRGFGKGEVKLSPSATLYALVQCTRDMSPANCGKCLSAAVETFRPLCENRTGCLFIYSSCYTRYDLRPFFFPLDRDTAGAEEESPAAVLTAVSP